MSDNAHSPPAQSQSQMPAVIIPVAPRSKVSPTWSPRPKTHKTAAMAMTQPRATQHAPRSRLPKTPTSNIHTPQDHCAQSIRVCDLWCLSLSLSLSISLSFSLSASSNRNRSGFHFARNYSTPHAIYKNITFDVMVALLSLLSFCATHKLRVFPLNLSFDR